MCGLVQAEFVQVLYLVDLVSFDQVDTDVVFDYVTVDIFLEPDGYRNFLGFSGCIHFLPLGNCSWFWCYLVYSEQVLLDLAPFV